MLRNLTCTTILLVLLASCATRGLTVAAGAPCEAAAYTVLDGFAGARRGRCTILSDDHVQLTIRPEDRDVTNPSAWYAFKLISRAPGTATITLQYIDGYHRYTPKTSTDGLHWTIVEDGSISKSPDGMRATIRVELAGEPLWLSAQELVLPAMYDLWNQKIVSQTDARLSVPGMSKADQPIPLLTINENAREVLLLTGRQHPPEVSGAFAFFAFYESLVADNELANQFRNRYQVLAIPLLNPDGVMGGNWRHNLGNTDLNRDWGPFNQPETRLVRDLLDRLDSEGRQVRVFLDFHSTGENVFYTQDDDNVTNPAGFTNTWLENARPRVPDTYPFTNRENPTGALGVSKNYMYHRYGIPAATYEVGDETDRLAIGQAAKVFAEELMRLMLEQTYE